MFKSIAKALIIVLFLTSFASAKDCPKGSTVMTIDGEEFCQRIYYLYDRFWWLKHPQADLLKYDPTPWEENLLSALKEVSSFRDINPQPEPPGIWDIQILSMIGLMVERLSPELRENLYEELNSTSERILPAEVTVEFGSAAKAERF